MTKEMHGLSNNGTSQHPLYRTWAGMKERCSNPRHMMYHRYGGRGIGYSLRWVFFTNFLEDMGDKPNKSMTLDRVDNDDDYTKENCKWSTRKEQSANITGPRGRPVGSTNKEIT